MDVELDPALSLRDCLGGGKSRPDVEGTDWRPRITENETNVNG